MRITSVQRFAWGVAFSRVMGQGGMEADLSYYKRRSAEETAAAATADNEIARQAHLELARRYDREVARLDVELKRASFRVIRAA